MELHETLEIIHSSSDWQELYLNTIDRFKDALSLVESTLVRTENPNRYLELKARKETLSKIIEDMGEISYKYSNTKE